MGITTDNNGNVIINNPDPPRRVDPAADNRAMIREKAARLFKLNQTAAAFALLSQIGE